MSSLYEQIPDEANSQEALKAKQEEDDFVDKLAEKLQRLSCSDTERVTHPSFVRSRKDADGIVNETEDCLYADSDASEILLDTRMVPIPSRGRAWMNAKSRNLQDDVMADVLSDPLLSPSLVIYTPALLMMLSGMPPKHKLMTLMNEQKVTLSELDELDKRDDAEAVTLRNFGHQKLGKLEADILAESLRVHALQGTSRLWPQRITAQRAAIEYHVLIRTLIENNGFYAKHTMEGMEVRTVIEDSNLRLTDELNGLLRDSNLRKVVGPYMTQLYETLNLRSLDDPELYGGEMEFGPKLLAEVQHCMVDYTLNLLRALERWILRVTAPHGLVVKIGRDAYEERVLPYFFTAYNLFPHQPRPEERGCPLQGALLREIGANIQGALEARIEAMPGTWDASPRFLAPAIELDNTTLEEEEAGDVQDDAFSGRKIRRVRRRNAARSLVALHLPMQTMNFEVTARHLYAIVNHLTQEIGASGLNESKTRSFWGNVVLPFKVARVPYRSVPGEILPEMLTGPLGSWVNLCDSSQGVREHRMPMFRQMPRLYFATKVASNEIVSSNEKLAHLIEGIRFKTEEQNFTPSVALATLCSSGDRVKFETALAAFSLAMGF